MHRSASFNILTRSTRKLDDCTFWLLSQLAPCCRGAVGSEEEDWASGEDTCATKGAVNRLGKRHFCVLYLVSSPQNSCSLQLHHFPASLTHAITLSSARKSIFHLFLPQHHVHQTYALTVHICHVRVQTARRLRIPKDFVRFSQKRLHLVNTGWT